MGASIRVGDTVWPSQSLAELSRVDDLEAELFVLEANIVPGLTETSLLPQAADAAGISVAATRYAGVLLSGALAGIGGAYLSIGQSSLFTRNMTAVAVRVKP